MRKLSLEALEVLDAIHRRGSFSGAALELGKVPSALSYTMQKLEEDLDVRLFRREGRRSVLTAAGLALAERGKGLLDETDQLVDHITQVATGWEPRLRITVDTTVDRGLVLPAVAELLKQHPSLEVSLVEQVLGGTWEHLFDDKADLIVGAIENVPGQYNASRQGIRVHPWHPVDMMFVAAPDHPVAQTGTPLDPETMATHRGVVISDTAMRLGSLSRGHFQPGNIMYVSNMREKLDAHMAGLGVGLLPRHLAEPAIKLGSLVEIETTEPITREPTVVAYRTSNQGQGLKYLVNSLT